MQVFAEVAERASLTEAGRARHVAGHGLALSQLRALARSTDTASNHKASNSASTDAGEEALQRCRQMLELSRDVQSVAGARRAAPGRARITTSTSFAAAYLADAVTDFPRAASAKRRSS